MTGNSDLLFHRIVTACAMLGAVAAVAIPRGLGARAQEPKAHACACGPACACASPPPTTPATVPATAPAISPDVLAKLAAARKASSEAAALSSMRVLVSAQAQMQAAGPIDGDDDGVGEYAYIGEMTGAKPLRVSSRRSYAIGSERLDPPVLSPKFGVFEGSVVVRKGYVFEVFLPDATGRAVGERDGGGADPARLPSPERSEVVWCAYAWPAEHGSGGERAFFVNQEGDVLQCANATKRYAGTASVPAADAAFAKGGKAGSIDQPLAAARTGNVGMDGEVWSVVE
jgi:hypothetical protein